MLKLPRVIELHPLGTETGGGQSAWFDVSDAREMIVEAVLTDSPTALTLLISTRDTEAGNKPYDFPYDRLRTFDPSQADDSAKSEKTKRNIITLAAAPVRACAVYKHLPSDVVRLRWIVTGSATFEARAILK